MAESEGGKDVLFSDGEVFYFSLSTMYCGSGRWADALVRVSFCLFSWFFFRGRVGRGGWRLLWPVATVMSSILYKFSLRYIFYLERFRSVGSFRLVQQKASI